MPQARRKRLMHPRTIKDLKPGRRSEAMGKLYGQKGDARGKRKMTTKAESGTFATDEFLTSRLNDNTDLWREAASLLEPPQRIHPADWIQEHVTLPEGVSPLRGRVRLFAYQGGVLDAVHDPGVREIILCWGTQLGKSAIWQWLIPYYACVNPAPIMVACADRDSAKHTSRLRMYPILRACWPAAQLLPARREQDTFLVNLLHTFLRFGWSGSVSSLGSDAIFFLVCTELDKWNRDATVDADPEDLAMNRVKAFANHKIIKESTPTREDVSRIWRNYQHSDQREYYVPCPHCGKYQVLKWGTRDPDSPGVKWEKGADGHSDPLTALATAWYQCAHCKGKIRDEHKFAMLRDGRWLKKGQTIKKNGVVEGAGLTSPRAGFHLSSLYSVISTWGDMAQLFLEKKEQGHRGLQDFINNWLAEPWRETHDAPEWEKVGERLRTDIPPRLVPDDALILTAGVDVHEYRVNYIVRAWAAHRTSWLIDFGECAELEEIKDLVLDAEYPRLNGEEKVAVTKCAIDSGYRPDQTYDFCRNVGPRAIAVRGQANWRAPWTIGNIDINPRTRKPYPGGQRIYHVHVNHYKPEVQHLLKNGPPAGEPGAFNLNSAVTENYLRQLCGEALVKTRNKRGFEVEEWHVVDTSVGNHFWDAEIYSWAAADIAGLRRLTQQKTERPLKLSELQRRKRGERNGR